jgi:hypothetical protein
LVFHHFLIVGVKKKNCQTKVNLTTILEQVHKELADRYT